MTNHNILSPTHTDTDQLALIGGELFIFDGALGLWKPLAFPSPSATNIALVSAIASDAEPTWRTLVESNNGSSLDFGHTAAPGTAPTLARDDHAHSFPALGTTPSTLAFGQAPAGGSSGAASKDDHGHGMPTIPPAPMTNYGFKGHVSSSSTALTDDFAWHLIPINTVDFDPASAWAGTPNYKWTCPKTGWYRIEASAEIIASCTSGVGQQQGAIRALLNGATDYNLTNFNFRDVLLVQTQSGGFIDLKLTAGDYIQWQYFAHSGGTGHTVTMSGPERANRFSIVPLEPF